MAPSQGDRHRRVAVCGAKDCRTSPGHDQLRRELGGIRRCEVIDSRCLDVCRGPVAVIGVGSDVPVVVRKVRGAKQRRDLVRLVTDGRLTDRVRSLQVRGKSARRAVRRVRPR